MTRLLSNDIIEGSVEEVNDCNIIVPCVTRSAITIDVTIINIRLLCFLFAVVTETLQVVT